jgi:hypothetical protein
MESYFIQKMIIFLKIYSFFEGVCRKIANYSLSRRLLKGKGAIFQNIEVIMATEIMTRKIAAKPFCFFYREE